MEIKIRELCKSYGKKKALQNFDAKTEFMAYSDQTGQGRAR